MKKKFLIAFIITIIIFILVGLIILIDNDIQMNGCLELRVPKLTRREIIELKEKDIFNDEKVIKIYLSKNQAKNMIKKMEKNENWKNTRLNERLEESMKFYTREEIYNKIPKVENIYWIFTNRSNGVENKHSIDELLNDVYYAVSIGILDIDNNILYYYEYDK